MRCSVIFLVGGFFLTGCTNSILGTLLAPESVVSGTATNLAEAGAETLSGASLNELTNTGSTLAELDNIIMENPNAVNIDRLQKTRDQISQTNTTNNKLISRDKSGEYTRRNNKTLPAGRGDFLSIKPPASKGKASRLNDRPSTIPMGFTLYEDYQPVHSMKFDSIRIR